MNIIALFIIFAFLLIFFWDLRRFERPERHNTESDIMVKCTTSLEGDRMKKSYCNEYFEITWTPSNILMEFTIINFTQKSILINWNRAFISCSDGTRSRVAHNGVRNIRASQWQPLREVRRKELYGDFVMPAETRYIVKGNDGRRSKTIYVCLPLVIEGRQRNYLYKFTANELIKNSIWITNDTIER